MKPSIRPLPLALGLVSLCGLFGTGCGKNAPAPGPTACAPTQLDVVAGSTGSAAVFLLDPMTSAHSSQLAPSSLKLDDLRSQVSLDHLTGQGVLKGTYVDAQNGTCSSGHMAYERDQNFSYPHSDSRFQEAMAYSIGDGYRAQLDQVGALFAGNKQVAVVAHCEFNDNAYYVRWMDAGNHLAERVCLGDSVETAGASYADDGMVTAHELQHATTVNTYSLDTDLNQFYYDEAGALNEAVSDFMSLLFSEKMLPPAFDPRTFSRWALGTYLNDGYGNPVSAERGAQRCPQYDPGFPNCAHFPEQSAAHNTLSYVYPDGMGWPYADNYRGIPGKVQAAFESNSAQEEIHNAGITLEGALWDVYEAIKANHSADHLAPTLVTKLVIEALKDLPKPNVLAASLSPVNFRGFAQSLVAAGNLLGISAEDEAALDGALTARGLLGGPLVPAAWAAAGPGTERTQGMKILDEPIKLRGWASQILAAGYDANTVIPQGISTGMNGQFDPGEVDAVWFDIQNISPVTAGGVTVTVSSSSPDVTFVQSLNRGFISATQAQIVYGKVNGTGIVNLMQQGGISHGVPTGSSYFLTNPYYANRWVTALWVAINPKAPHGETVSFRIEAQPTNGETATFDVPTRIR